MPSAIRELLADAQAAEVRGDRAEAARLLRRAAAHYRDANNHTRALKMLRHARRLEGAEDEEQDGGAAARPALPEAAPVAPTASAAPTDAAPPRRRHRRELEEREPALAAAALEAWCLFCCLPGAEVGQLVAGPAGAFICRACVGLAAGLLGAPAPPAAPVPHAAASSRPGRLVETRAVQAARGRLEAPAGRATLLVGPEGSGKSALLSALGEVLRLDGARGAGVLAGAQARRGRGGAPLLLEVSGSLAPGWEDAVLELLDAGARVVLSVRAQPPPPALVLSGASGDEPLYDTEGLAAALGALVPRALLARVDGVVVLPAPDAEALEALAVGLVATRGDLELSADAVQKIARLAHQSGKGAHELVALLARVPRGKWAGKP